MPIEVRQLVIRARVEDTDTAQGPANTRQGRQAGMNAREVENIINQCVDKVMRILNRQNER